MSVIRSLLTGTKFKYTERNKRKVIKHEDLEREIISKGFSVEYQTLLSTLEHSVVLCRISGAEKTVAKLGEFTPGSALKESEKNYPVVTAAARAFDRAAIVFLDLEAEAYSSKEISENPRSTSPLLPDVETHEGTADTRPILDTIKPPRQPKTAPSEREVNPDDRICFGRYKGLKISQALKNPAFRREAAQLIELGTSFRGEAMKQISYIEEFMKGENNDRRKD